MKLKINNGLKKLGYNVTHYNSQANDREDILSYIRLTGKNYAFFFFGHSNSSNITAKNGYASGTINANDIECMEIKHGGEMHGIHNIINY